MNFYNYIIKINNNKRDTRVELVSQPWEGWAQPIYQSRMTKLWQVTVGWTS